MYTDNAPQYYYALVAILAIVLSGFICLKIYEYIIEVAPRRKRTRRFLESLHDGGNEIDDEVVDHWEQNELNKAVRKANTDADALRDEYEAATKRGYTGVPVVGNPVLDRNPLQGTTTLVADPVNESFESTEFSRYRCTNCNKKMFLEVSIPHNYCPCCGLFNKMIH